MSYFQGTPISAERAREVLDGVLKRPEFRDEEAHALGLITKFLDWLGELFGGTVGQLGAGTAEVFMKILWIAVMVMAGIMLIRLWLTYLRARRPSAKEKSALIPSAVVERVASLRADAREAEAAGDFTRALRLYFFALVVGLGQSGQLSYDDAWTNRELLERGEPSATLLRLLKPLVGELDEHSFGKRPTEASEVQRFAELCDQMLGGGAA